MEKNEVRGGLAIAVATIFYGLVGVYSRMIGESFGALSQVWIRNLLVSILVLIPILITKQWQKIDKKDLPWIIFWEASATIATIAFFVAVNRLTLGTTIILFYAGSNVSGYLSGTVFFKEKLTVMKVVALLISFIGVGTIYSFNLNVTEILYPAIAFIAGFCAGLWNTLSKKFSANYSQLQIVAFDGLLGFFFALVLALLIKQPIPTLELSISWLGIILYSFTQVLLVALTVYGFKRLEAQTGTLIMPLEVFWASLFGYLFYNETLGLTTVIGGVLIILGVILPNLGIFQKNRLNVTNHQAT